MGEFEDFIKAKYPVDYESLKEKYPNAPIVEFYGDEQDVWNHQQSKIEQLENLLALQRHKVKALEVELTNSRNYSDKLHEKIHDAELQIAVHWGADEDTDSVLRDVEKALRGES